MGCGVVHDEVGLDPPSPVQEQVATDMIRGRPVRGGADDAVLALVRLACGPTRSSVRRYRLTTLAA